MVFSPVLPDYKDYVYQKLKTLQYSPYSEAFIYEISSQSHKKQMFCSYLKANLKTLKY